MFIRMQVSHPRPNEAYRGIQGGDNMFKRILLIGLISILVGIQNVPTVNSQGLTVVSNLIKGDVPTDPRSPAWDKAESNIIPLSSQIIANPRTFKLPKGKSSVREVNVKSLNNGKDIALTSRTELFPFGSLNVLGLAMIWELRGMMLLLALSHAGDLGSVGTSPFIRFDTTVNPWELTVGTFWIPTRMLIKPINKILLNILSPPRIPRYASFGLG